MKKLMESIKSIQEVREKWNDHIWAIKLEDELRVHVSKDAFIDIVDSLEMLPCHVNEYERESDTYNIELNIEKDGIQFFCILTDHEYEMDFREWLYEEPNIDEEFLVGETSPMPENERLMKLAGHKMHDFM